MAADLQAFDARMDAVMAQAASFDADAITHAQRDLGTWVQALRPDALSKDELGQVRGRLRQYLDLCSFLQSTLNQALAQAGRIEGAGYTGHGPSLDRAHPLMRRYG